VRKLLDGDSLLNGQALFLTDGQPVACWTWITHILQAADVPVPSRSLSYRAAYRLGALLEGIYGLLRIRSEPPMTRFIAAQLALDHYFNIELARKLLDYQPVVERAAELARCQSWLRGLASR
jgi:hypothetical protein